MLRRCSRSAYIFFFLLRLMTDSRSMSEASGATASACMWMCLHPIAVGTAPATRTAHAVGLEPVADRSPIKCAASNLEDTCLLSGTMPWCRLQILESSTASSWSVCIQILRSTFLSSFIQRERETNVWQDFRGRNVYLS
jgi:hypothetical protein